LFWPNGFVILSNGSEAKVGATYAPWGFFGDWKVIDADGTRGVVALETAIRGTCAHDRLLDMVENFVAYVDSAEITMLMIGKIDATISSRTVVD
jgi:type I restriction enzyme R subunit